MGLLGLVPQWKPKLFDTEQLGLWTFPFHLQSWGEDTPRRRGWTGWEPLPWGTPKASRALHPKPWAGGRVGSR